MEPAVRGARTEPAIIVVLPPKFSGLTGDLAVKAPCGERDFWMQRPEAPIGQRDRRCTQRLNDQNNSYENARRNRLFLPNLGICGLAALDGGAGMDRTANSPSSHRTGL
jgi:hypothetical protein